MTKYLLDTNIISNLTKPAPSASLIAWMSRQLDDDLFIASFTLAEIKHGIVLLPQGRKRRALETWFEGPEGPEALFAERILAFDEKAALAWANLMAEGRRGGRGRNPLDMIIAAVAQANACTLVTDNERDFAGLAILNPLRAGT